MKQLERDGRTEQVQKVWNEAWRTAEVRRSDGSARRDIEKWWPRLPWQVPAAELRQQEGNLARRRTDTGRGRGSAGKANIRTHNPCNEAFSFAGETRLRDSWSTAAAGKWEEVKLDRGRGGRETNGGVRRQGKTRPSLLLSLWAQPCAELRLYTFWIKANQSS